LLPSALQRITWSPLHATNSVGVHETAMHSPGSPPKRPSTSQNGNAWSLQIPSLHDLGFAFVQPAADANANTRIETRHHMDQ